MKTWFRGIDMFLVAIIRNINSCDMNVRIQTVWGESFHVSTIAVITLDHNVSKHDSGEGCGWKLTS